MTQIGELPLMRRSVIRSMPNPMDKCTIVSIYPKEINEYKPTIFPGKFQIPAGRYDIPGLLVVHTSYWIKDNGPEQPLTEVTCGSVEVANAIINDYVNGLLEWTDGGKPGLFFVPGEYDIPHIKKDCKELLDKAKARQENWFRALVRLADAMWSKSNNNPMAIADDMRLAAQELGVAKNKGWMQDFNTMEMTNCPACGSLRNNNFPVCIICKTIVDPKKYADLGLKQAV